MEQAPKNHYDALGVPASASAGAIRSAYRKLALKYHPDHDGSGAATEKFIQVTAAYEILSNAERKREYDRVLQLHQQIGSKERSASARSSATTSRGQGQRAATSTGKTADRITLNAQVDMLQNLFAKRRFGEAEVLANVILAKDPKVAMAYDVLAEIVRSRGELRRAAKLYALALQMEPSNATYLRKHEDMLRMTAAEPTRPGGPRPRAESGSSLAPFAGFFVVAAAAAYVALDREPPLVPDVALFSTWTLGLLIMMLLAGVAVGASMSLAGWLDRLSSPGSTSGRLPPGVALLFVAIANFWLAGLLYLQSGAARKAFDYSAGRLVGAVGATTSLFALAAQLSGRLDPIQVLLWGGNAAYVGAIAGWLAADLLND